ncbi:5837_t:CDS:1, partial [Gigaspora rosea]
MFTGVDYLEKVIHKLDIHTAGLNNSDFGISMAEDELEIIYQTVVHNIKEMEENIERLERIMLK